MTLGQLQEFAKSKCDNRDFGYGGVADGIFTVSWRRTVDGKKVATWGCGPTPELAIKDAEASERAVTE